MKVRRGAAKGRRRCTHTLYVMSLPWSLERSLGERDSAVRTSSIPLNSLSDFFCVKRKRRRTVSIRIPMYTPT